MPNGLFRRGVGFLASVSHRALSAPPASGEPLRRWRHVFDTASTGADHFRTAVRAAFRLIDTNHDGIASREEVSRALRKYSLVQELLLLPPHVSEAEFEQVSAARA